MNIPHVDANSTKKETVQVRVEMTTKEKFYRTYDEWKVRNGHSVSVEDFLNEMLTMMQGSMRPGIIR